MARTVELENETTFRIAFGGKDFKEILAVVKNIPGRLYNPTNKEWMIPINPENIKTLKENKFTFMESTYLYIGKPTSPYKVEKKILPDVIIDESLFNKSLRPYQKEAVRRLCRLNGRGIISFPPGCGKTAIATSYFRVNLDKLPLLVICPAFMKIHWQRELLHWGGLSSYICSGKDPKPPKKKYPVWIINYELLQSWLDVLAKKFSSIIIDECQMVANKSTNRSEAFLALAKHTKHIIPISGTPIKNRPREFYTILHALDPKMFHNEWNFLHHFCSPRIVYGCWNFDGASNIEELHELVSNYMIRKERAEILPDLPTKMRYVIPMELENKNVYKEAEDEIEGLLKKNKKKEAHEKLMELSNTAFPLKKKSVCAWIDNWLQNNPDDSLVIMAYHHAVIDYLKDKYEDAIVIDGRKPSDKRQELVDKFQAGKSRILIGQIMAAGIGFSMDKAHTMVIAEVCYVPGDLEQAEDRILRMTQLADKVEIYYLVGEGTIEDSMLDTVESKANKLSRILDGKGLKFFEENN